MNGDWWRFWDGENGFNLGEFEHAYEEERRARGQRPISQARLRLMRLRSNGLKCLETNAYRNEQLGGAGIGAPNAALLAALIRHIPNLKAVIVHGNVAREYWRELELPLPAGVQSYYLRAFRMESYEKIDEVSRKILGPDQVKNPKAPAVKREAEEDWGRRCDDSHAGFRPLLGNDGGGGGSGSRDTANDRPTARARMGDRGLCERL
jgi:hypothetical protein